MPGSILNTIPRSVLNTIPGSILSLPKSASPMLLKWHKRPSGVHRMHRNTGDWRSASTLLGSWQHFLRLSSWWEGGFLPHPRTARHSWPFRSSYWPSVCQVLTIQITNHNDDNVTWQFDANKLSCNILRSRLHYRQLSSKPAIHADTNNSHRIFGTTSKLTWICIGTIPWLQGSQLNAHSLLHYTTCQTSKSHDISHYHMTTIQDHSLPHDYHTRSFTTTWLPYKIIHYHMITTRDHSLPHDYHTRSFTTTWLPHKIIHYHMSTTQDHSLPHDYHTRSFTTTKTEHTQIDTCRQGCHYNEAKNNTS